MNAIKKIISLLEDINNSIGEGEDITEIEVQSLINDSIDKLRGNQDEEFTLSKVSDTLQNLLYSLYNDDESEGELGDIIKLQNALESSPYIVAQINTGSMGYRKWSDGRLEQWGKATTRAQDTAGTNFNLLESFKDTNYTLTASVNEQMFAFIYAKPNTAKQVNIRVNNGNDKSVVGANVSWKAEGYWK